MKIQAWVNPEPDDAVKLKPPEIIERANQVILYDDIGQPVAVFMQISPDHIWFTKAGDEDFQEALHKLGIRSEAQQVVRQEVGTDIKFPSETGALS